MSGFRLVRLRGSHEQDEWPLPPGRKTLVGRRVAQDKPPDVDLAMDRLVSRSHARLWLERDTWWLEDLGSKHGTRVGERLLQPRQPIALVAGVEIELGKTMLGLFPPNWHPLRAGNLLLEVGLASVINPALRGSGERVVSRLVMRNRGSTSSPVSELRLSLPGFVPAALKVPALKGGERRTLSRPKLVLDPHAAPVGTERVWRPLTIELNGAPLPHHESIGIWSLAPNEWPSLPEYRSTLAAFVMPNHPTIALIARQALEGLPATSSAEVVLERIFCTLRDRWHVDYRFEPPSYEVGSQKIRLPDQVITDTAARSGNGTCLDLALLIAGCLESFRLQPLIAIVDLGRSGHALVGCWRRPTHTLEPVMTDREQLIAGAVWLDPNGCTRDPAQRCDSEQARGLAIDRLRAGPLFAIDVAAARLEGTIPLPFSGEPDWSEPVVRALAGAQAAAESIRVSLAVLPLMIGLLEVDGLTRRVFRAAGVDPSAAAQRLKRGLRSVRRSQKPSRHYAETLALAKSNARSENAPSVGEGHLLTALLSCPSAALDQALVRLGTDRANLRRALERCDFRRRPSSADASVFLGPDPQ